MSQGQSMLDINRRDLQVWSEHQSGHFWPQVGHNHSIFCTLLTIWAVLFVNMTFYDIFSQITHIFWIDGNHSSAFLIDSFPENVPFLYRRWWVLNQRQGPHGRRFISVIFKYRNMNSEPVFHFMTSFKLDFKWII